MMDRSHRHHGTASSFTFWMFLLSAISLVVAWKVDLLPFTIGPAETGEVALVEQTLPAPQPTGLEEAEPDSVFSAQTEPPVQETVASQVADEQQIIEPAKFAASAEVTGAVPDEAPAFVEAGTQTAKIEATAEAAGRSAEQRRVTPVSAEMPREIAGETPHVEVAAAINSDWSFDQIAALSQTGQVEDDIEAHRRLSEIYWQQPEARERISKLIDTTARRIYFTPQPHYMPAYEVQPGDLLQSIAHQYNVPWQYLARLNRVEPRRIRVGQRLKVIKGPFHAVVDLSDYEITVHAYGHYMCRFPVGIGKDHSTPTGKFSVQDKLEDPTYYGPDGVVAHDDPTNPLGEYWIDLGDSYGIHGTIDANSIGKAESRGCVRLQAPHIAVLYDLLGVGSEVIIRP